MKLLTTEIQHALPALYARDDQGREALAAVHYFFQGWDWFASEGSYCCEDHWLADCERCPKEKFTKFLFFGLVCGIEEEIGYFSLAELESVGAVERDLYWTPKPLRKCYRSMRGARA